MRDEHGMKTNHTMARSTKPASKSSSAKKSKEQKRAPRAPRAATWELRLYVAGQTPKSVAAFGNLRRICEEHLQGQYHIEVVDLLENPQLARDDQILALPTLVRKLPPPIRKIVGDLSNSERVLVGLQLRSRG